MSQNQSVNNPTPNWRELRAQERQERRAARGDNRWIMGAVLVLIGIVLLLQNMNAFVIYNWWALFILLPAFGSLAGAWRLYTNSGEVSAAVIGSFTMGLVFLVVAGMFLFNLTANWSVVLPALLILLGVSMLIPALMRK